MQEAKTKHWDSIYKSKDPEEVSWTQSIPVTSIDLFEHCKAYQKDAIIDIGCGEAGIISYWVKRGLKNIFALDISKEALSKLEEKLPANSEVTFIDSDIRSFESDIKFSFWHDRAAFHFLTEKADVEMYVQKVNKMVSGYLCIGTFSKKGPQKCSGLPIAQYDVNDLVNLFSKHFELLSSEEEIHKTPFNTEQAFTFCLFKRKN